MTMLSTITQTLVRGIGGDFGLKRTPASRRELGRTAAIGLFEETTEGPVPPGCDRERTFTLEPCM